VVNEIRYDGTMATAYNAVGSGAEAVFVPLVYRAYGGWNSGLQIQNTGAAPTTITVRFFRQDGQAMGGLQSTLDPGAARSFYLPSVPTIPDGWAGSATVTSSDGQLIAVIVNHIRD
jgi:hypothetical protein